MTKLQREVPVLRADNRILRQRLISHQHADPVEEQELSWKAKYLEQSRLIKDFHAGLDRLHGGSVRLPAPQQGKISN